MDWDVFWPPGPQLPPRPEPNLLANERGKGLHLQGGAHDDEEVHLPEVLWGSTSESLHLCPAPTEAGRDLPQGGP